MLKFKIFFYSIFVYMFFSTNCFGIPVISSSEENENRDEESEEESNEILPQLPPGFSILNVTSGVQNGSAKNLYVVKAVVYEIGILTEVDDNDTSSSEETQERVDLTFFDAHKNSSHINLGNIPLPIQTNVSGQVLTGIAPVNIGAFSHPSELLDSLPLTGTIVNITHSDTALFMLTTNNITNDEKRHKLKASDLKRIPKIGDLLPNIEPSSKADNSVADPKLLVAKGNNNISSV